jgi:hypothetical protein
MPELKTDRALTEDENARVDTHLAEKLGGRACPLCGKTPDWEPARRSIMLVQENRPMSVSADAGWDGTPVVAAACQSCGFVALLSAPVVGLGSA